MFGLYEVKFFLLFVLELIVVESSVRVKLAAQLRVVRWQGRDESGGESAHTLVATRCVGGGMLTHHKTNTN